MQICTDPFILNGYCEGDIQTSNETQCTIVGCLRRNINGGGFRVYRFNTNTCIFSKFL